MRLEEKTRSDKQLWTPSCLAKKRMGWPSILLTPQFCDICDWENLTLPDVDTLSCHPKSGVLIDTWGKNRARRTTTEAITEQIGRAEHFPHPHAFVTWEGGCNCCLARNPPIHCRDLGKKLNRKTREAITDNNGQEQNGLTEHFPDLHTCARHYPYPPNTCPW